MAEAPSFDLGIPSEFGSSFMDELDLLKLDGVKQSDLDLLNSELDVLNADDRASMPSQVRVNVDGGPSFEFLEEDETFMKVLAEGGDNPSASVDKWARNRLEKFRKFKKLDTIVPFEQLPLALCSKLLVQFFAQVTKKDGSLYPSQTLMSLYRAYHRIMRRTQEVRVQASGVDELPFSLRNSPLFKAVGICCCMSMKRSKLAGANLPRKKSAIISLADERTILDHPCTNFVSPRGLQAQSIYYLLCRFAIRGGQELYNLEKHEFQFGKDEAGCFVCYDERLSKNYRVSLDRYQDEHFRLAVCSHNADMVQTLECLIDHLPVSGTFLFYQCIDNPRTHAWYSTLRVSARKLTSFMRELHRECGLVSDAVTNKSGRTTCVMRMASKGVPPAVGMRITGHKSQGAYTRYDRLLEAQVCVAQLCVGEGSAYQENVKSEIDKFKSKVIEGATKKQKGDYSLVAVSEIQDSTPPIACKAITAGDGGSTAGDALMSAIVVQDGNKELSNSIVSQPMETVDLKEDSWMDSVDWDHFMQPFDCALTIVTPINSVFAKGALSNCTVHISIGSVTPSNTPGSSNLQ